MANIDLESLSLSDLKQLQKAVAKAIAGYDQRQKGEVRALLETRARELGFDLADLAGATKKRAKGTTTGPKYRHPENPEITWTGRGRRPNWFVAAVDAGRSPRSLEV